MKDFSEECEKTKKTLPAGPWMDEPHFEAFEAHGLKCWIRRSPHIFVWCGYVGIPQSHPLFGKTSTDFDCHGGITFSDKENDLWVFGFDFGHYLDVIPSFEREIPNYKMHTAKYFTMAEVKEEVESLAEHLAQFECENK